MSQIKEQNLQWIGYTLEKNKIFIIGSVMQCNPVHVLEDAISTNRQRWNVGVVSFRSHWHPYILPKIRVHINTITTLHTSDTVV